MPRFPGYDQQTSVQGGPAPRAQGEQFASPLAGAGQVGQALTEVQQAKILEQRVHDETAVNDLYANQFDPAVRSLMNDPKTGYFAKQGRDALDGLQPTSDAALKLRTQFRDSLQNDNQKKMFDVISRRHLEAQLDAASRHATRENQVWQAQTSDAVVKNAAENAIVSFNDPAKVDGYIRSGIFEIETYGHDNGQSAETIAQRSRAFARDAHTAVAERLLVDDPLSAQSYIRAHDKDLAGPKFAALEHQLKSAVLPVLAKRAVDAAISGPAVENIDGALEAAGEPLINAVIQQESGGNAGAVSPKGARGLMQLMPDTARATAAKLGLPYDEALLTADTPQGRTYNKALGSAYFREQLAKYGGNVALALAAYNAGPGTVDDWLSGTNKTGKNPSKVKFDPNDPNLAQSIPFKETRDYVSAITAKLQKVPAPTNTRDTRASLVTYISNGERLAEAMYPNDPVFRDLVVTGIKGRINTIVTAQDGVQRQAAGALMTAALGASGGAKPLTLDELFKAPGARDAWAIMDPNAQRGVLALLDHNARASQGLPMRAEAGVVQDLFQRIYLPDDDPRKLRTPGQLMPYFGTGLNTTAFDWLSKKLDELQTPEGQRLSGTRNSFFSGVKHQFDKSTMVKLDEKGGEDFYKFQQYATDQERKYRDAGKNPYDLYNPNSPDYLGKHIPTFQRSLEQQIRDMAASLSTKPLPPEQQRKPGESIDDYRKRMGMK